MFLPEVLDLPRAFARPTEVVGALESPEIATASLAFPGTVSSDALEAWLDHTIGLLGPMLLRMKAMLDIENAPGPTVLHAVRGLLHQPSDLKAWPTPDRQNRVVLIGRDVEPQILMDCLARLASTAMPATRRIAG
jgi:G3E family GTPase